jgi:hypothetical protein
MDNNRYYQGKIYKLVDNTNGNLYVGSTCEKKLCRRLQKHVCGYKIWKRGGNQRKMRSFDIIKNNDYKIILLENYPCETKEELLAREQYYIDTLVCVNKNNTYHNKLEYQRKWSVKNREKVNQYVRDWRSKNPDKKKETDRAYRYSVKIGNINKIDPFLFLND